MTDDEADAKLRAALDKLGKGDFVRIDGYSPSWQRNAVERAERGGLVICEFVELDQEGLWKVWKAAK